MKKLLFATLALAPAIASAQTLGNVETLLRSIGRLVNLALPIVVGIALLAFFWGLMKWIFAKSGGDEKATAEGKQIMIYGIIALFVMVSVWGLVRFIGTAFGIDQDSSIEVPSVSGL